MQNRHLVQKSYLAFLILAEQQPFSFFVLKTLFAVVYSVMVKVVPSVVLA